MESRSVYTAREETIDTLFGARGMGMLIWGFSK